MEPTTITQLSPLPHGLQALRYSVLLDGTLAVIATDVDLESEWERIRLSDGRRLRPPSRIDDLIEAGFAHLFVWATDGWKHGPTFALETAYPLIDRFLDGRWLVVGARTEGGPNARIITPDGELKERFMLGDGIEHVATDTEDRIWVGWFDEGVFGNEDWIMEEREWPPSSNGMARFSSNGELIDEPQMPKGAGSVHDCYAMTVDADVAWTCSYTDFSLVKHMPGGTSWFWRGAPAGTTAIAVHGNHALLAGGYFRDQNRVNVVGLHQGRRKVEIIHRSTLPLRAAKPGNDDLSPVWQSPDLLVGRAGALHLVDAQVWRQWRVAELAIVPTE